MPSLVEIGPVVLEKKILNFVSVLLLFLNYLPLEIGWALHLNKLEIPFTRGCIVLSLVEIGWRKFFLNFVSVFSLFRNYLPLENFNKLEPSSPKDALCQVWLKLVLWFWRFFFKFRKFANSYLSPLGKGRGPSFEQT